MLMAVAAPEPLQTWVHCQWTFWTNWYRLLPKPSVGTELYKIVVMKDNVLSSSPRNPSTGPCPEPFHSKSHLQSVSLICNTMHTGRLCIKWTHNGDVTSDLLFACPHFKSPEIARRFWYWRLALKVTFGSLVSISIVYVKLQLQRLCSVKEAVPWTKIWTSYYIGPINHIWLCNSRIKHFSAWRIFNEIQGDTISDIFATVRYYPQYMNISINDVCKISRKVSEIMW